MELVPIAYPLPYGENLEEVEALHLVRSKKMHEKKILKTNRFFLLFQDFSS